MNRIFKVKIDVKWTRGTLHQTLASFSLTLNRTSISELPFYQMKHKNIFQGILIHRKSWKFKKLLFLCGVIEFSPWKSFVFFTVSDFYFCYFLLFSRDSRVWLLLQRCPLLFKEGTLLHSHYDCFSKKTGDCSQLRQHFFHRKNMKFYSTAKI